RGGRLMARLLHLHVPAAERRGARIAVEGLPEGLPHQLVEELRHGEVDPRVRGVGESLEVERQRPIEQGAELAARHGEDVFEGVGHAEVSMVSRAWRAARVATAMIGICGFTPRFVGNALESAT